MPDEESLSREVEEARYVAIIGADHSWRCRYEPDPERLDKQRPCEVREDTCCCGAVEEIDALVAAVRKDALKDAREALRTYIETPGQYERDKENWALLQQAVGYEAAPPEGGNRGMSMNGGEDAQGDMPFMTTRYSQQGSRYGGSRWEYRLPHWTTRKDTVFVPVAVEAAIRAPLEERVRELGDELFRAEAQLTTFGADRAQRLAALEGAEAQERERALRIEYEKDVTFYGALGRVGTHTIRDATYRLLRKAITAPLEEERDRLAARLFESFQRGNSLVVMVSQAEERAGAAEAQVAKLREALGILRDLLHPDGTSREEDAFEVARRALAETVQEGGETQ